MLKYGSEGQVLVTNQTLADITGVPYGKIRRHVKETLPADMRATLQSGYAREYSLQDGYFIYLVVHLVADLKVTAPEAKFILNSIKDWLTDKRLFPGEDAQGWLNSQADCYEIQIMRETVGTGFCCVAIKRLKKEIIEEPSTYREEYILEKISGNCDDVDALNLRLLKVSDLMENFQAGIDQFLRAGRSERKRKKRKFRIRRG
jgi:hypothetical protein